MMMMMMMMMMMIMVIIKDNNKVVPISYYQTVSILRIYHFSLRSSHDMLGVLCCCALHCRHKVLTAIY